MPQAFCSTSTHTPQPIRSSSAGDLDAHPLVEVHQDHPEQREAAQDVERVETGVVVEGRGGGHGGLRVGDVPNMRLSWRRH